MPTKLGNGGHGHENYDPKTGKYVESSTGSSSLVNNSNNNSQPLKNSAFSQKIGLNITQARNFVNFVKSKRKGFSIGKNVEECEKIGNNILGGKTAVFYDESTNVEYMNQMNSALFDLTNDFGDLIKPTLEKYGTKASLSDEQIREIFSRGLERLKASIPNDFLEKYPSIKKTFMDNFSKEYSIYKFFDGDSSVYAYSHGIPIVESQLDKNRFSSRYAKYPILNFNQPFYMRSIIAFNGSQNFFQTSGLNKEQKTNGESYIEGNFHYTPGKGSAYATASHELGHHIDLVLRNYMSNDEKIEIYNLVYPHLKGSDRQGYGGDPTSSTYSKYNDKEFVAEAFSDVYSNEDKALDYNKQIVEVYKKLYSKYFANKGE